ncbi:MAG: TonB family protein [Burkholderiaceae bacterium]|nr:TonB family protein [Burkholderiaceae bacterium]
MIPISLLLPLGLRITSLALLGTLFVFAGMAQAQSASSNTKEAPNADTAAERTKRQAENPYKWIIMQDDKPRAKAAAKPQPSADREKKPAPTPPFSPAPERAARGAPAATSPTAPAVASQPNTTASSVKPEQAAPSAPVVAAPAPVPVPVTTPVIPAVEANNPSTALTSPSLPEKPPEPQVPETLNLLVQVPPELTREVVSRGIRQGRVKVKFNVMPDGSVADAQVMTSTNRLLNSPVLAAVSKWKYAPIKQIQEHGAEVAFNLDQ